MIYQLFRALYKRTRKSLTGQWGIVLLFLTSMFIYSASGFMYFEGEAQGKDWEDAFWWSIVSMTTVGYGDIFPESTYGRLLVGLPTMLVGVAALGYILSALAAILMENKLKELKGMSTFESGKHIIICRFVGLTSTIQMIDELYADPQTNNTPVVIIDDTLDELPKELAEREVTFIKGNPASDSVLERANIGEAQAVIIQAELSDGENSDLKNLAIALNIEKTHPEINTVVHCLDPDNVRFFERCGCDSVVCIVKLVNQVIVQELQDQGIHKVVSELTSNTYGKQFYIADIPSQAQTFGDVTKTLAENEVLALGIRRDGKNHIAPSRNYSVKTSDKVISISSARE